MGVDSVGGIGRDEKVDGRRWGVGVREDNNGHKGELTKTPEKKVIKHKVL